MVGAAQCDLLAGPAMTKPTLEHRVNPARGRGKGGGYRGPLAMACTNLITKFGCILRALDGRLGENKPQTDRARRLEVAPQASRDTLGRNPILTASLQTNCAQLPQSPSSTEARIAPAQISGFGPVKRVIAGRKR